MKKEELQKYLDIQSQRGNDYGGFNHAKRHYDFLYRSFISNSPLSICDLGCGTGKFPIWVKEVFPQHIVFGIDPVFVTEGNREGVVFLRGDSTSIPIGKVDILTSFDVMEHIHPEDLEASMAEITRVSETYVTKIAYKPSGSRGVNGEELHPLVKSPSWWLDYLKIWYKDVKVMNNLFVCTNGGMKFSLGLPG